MFVSTGSPADHLRTETILQLYQWHRCAPTWPRRRAGASYEQRGKQRWKLDYRVSDLILVNHARMRVGK